MSTKKITYPVLEIHMDKIRENVKNVHQLSLKKGVGLTGVVKGCNANLQVTRAFETETYHSIGSSRISQLKKIKKAGVQSPLMLVRIPMLSELQEVVAYADISLNSEKETLLQLNRCCKEQDTIHKVVIMADLGDLREGVWDKDDFVELCEFVESDLIHLNLYGIGTNLGCYGSIRPTVENMTLLSDLADRVEKRIKRPLDIVSGGATSALPLVVNGQMPEKINHLRVGEGILLARDLTAPDFCYLDFMNTDTFILKAQVIEIEEKPSYPVGEFYVDAFRNKPVYEDRGIRRRAILGVGRQDFGHHESLLAVDPDIELVGSSSDHLIVDITGMKRALKVGDTLDFTLYYQGLLFLSLCSDVQKRIL